MTPADTHRHGCRNGTASMVDACRSSAVTVS
jgi:hypothetical protein